MGKASSSRFANNGNDEKKIIFVPRFFSFFLGAVELHGTNLTNFSLFCATSIVFK